MPELSDPAIREVFVGQYRLFYRVQRTRVVVLGFLHGAQDFVRWRAAQRDPDF